MNTTFGYRYGDSLVKCCGVLEIGQFVNASMYNDPDVTYWNPPAKTKVKVSGTGLFVATFDKAQVFYKEHLESLYEKQYDSGWVYNNHSGNEMCLCVFMHSEWEHNPDTEEYSGGEDEDLD